MIKNVLWVLPFVFFVSGYVGMARLAKIQQVTVPVVLGMPLKEGLVSLSSVNLYGYILNEKESAHLAPGTILEQFPAGGTTAKAHQPVSLLIARSPIAPETPSLIGRQRSEIALILQQKSLFLKEFWLEHVQPHGICIAQYPLPGDPVYNQTVTLYYSKSMNDLYIMPDLVGHSLTETQHIFNEYAITPIVTTLDETVNNSHQCTQHCIIRAQRPLAGTVISLTEITKIVNVLIQHEN